jgi:hypothetical protein
MAQVKVTDTPTIDSHLASIVQAQMTGGQRGARGNNASVEAIIAGLGHLANLKYAGVMPSAKGPDSASKSALRYNRVKAGNTPTDTVRAIYSDLIAAGATDKYALSECAKTRADIAYDSVTHSYYTLVG